MNKFIKAALIFILILGFCAVLVACSGIDNYGSIERIEVNAESIAQPFLRSEFDVSKILLDVTYAASGDDPEETVQVPVKLSYVKAADQVKFTYAGNHQITVIYSKFDVTFNITIVDSVVSRYTVNFYDEDGNRINSQTVAAGSDAIVPPVPNKPEHTFLRWVYLNNRENPASTMNVTSNLDLIAQYRPNAYLITFQKNLPGRGIEPWGYPDNTNAFTVSVPHGANALDYAPEISIIWGYSDGRWEDVSKMYNISASQSFSAVYTRDYVKVTFEYLNSTGALITETKLYAAGEAVNPSQSAALNGAGKQFVGWYTGAFEGSTYNKYKVPTEFPYAPIVAEMTFYAYYIDENIGNAGLSYSYIPSLGGYIVDSFNGDYDTVCIPETYLGDPVLEIADGIFKDYPITRFHVSAYNDYFIAVDGVLYNKNKTTLIAYPSAKEGAAYAVENETTSIGAYAFYGARYLMNVALGSKINEIGAYSFAECISLTSFRVESGVTKIGEGAFKVKNGEGGLSAFSFVTDSKLGTIGDEAFFGLSNLTEIYLPATLTVLGKSVFERCTSLQEIGVQGGNVFTVERGALYSSDKTVLYAYPARFGGNSSPDFSVNASTKVILSGAFSFAKLGAITINSDLVLSANSIVCPGLVTLRILSDNLSAEWDYSGLVFGGFNYVPENILVKGGISNGAWTNLVSNFTERVIAYNAGAWSDFESYFSDFIYRIVDEKAIILGSRNTSSTLEIPATIGNFEVTEIAEKAFESDMNITNVILPAGLVKIGERAFYGMKNLVSVEFKASLKIIGNKAFYDCPSLVSVTGADDLKISNFGQNVFDKTAFVDNAENEFTILGGVLIKYNWYATSVRIPTNVHYIASDAFKEKRNLTSVLFSDISGAYRIEVIDSFAFQFCFGITELRFGTSLKEIREKAFYRCDNLYVVHFGIRDDDQSLNRNLSAFNLGIDRDPVFLQFTNTEIYSLIYDYSNETDSAMYTDMGVVFVKARTFEDLEQSVLRHFAGWYFDGARTQPVIFPLDIRKIPGLVQGIRIYAKYLNQGTAPSIDDVGTDRIKYELGADGRYTVIGYDYQAGGDTTVIIPRRFKNIAVTSIAANAFSGISAVRNVVFPTDGRGSNVSTISLVGENAFFGTAWLDNFYGDFVTVNNILIKYKGDSKIVQIPSGISLIADGAFMDNDKIEKVIFSSEIPIVQKNAFRNCTELKEVVFPENLNRIENGAFFGCAKLSIINFSDCKNAIGFVGADALEGTAWLNNYVDDSVIIEGKIFYKYKGNGSRLTIPQGIVMISDEAFRFNGQPNERLIDVVLPASVEYIGRAAFAGTYVVNVYIYGGTNRLSVIFEEAFLDCKQLVTIDLSLAKNLTTISESAFEGCINLINVRLPASLTTLGLRAFYNCERLATLSVDAGSRLKKISEKAFMNCTSLNTVTFLGASELVEIGDYAFENCSVLRTFSAPNAMITTLGSRAFYDCGRLQTFTINGINLINVGSDALYNVRAIENSATNLVIFGNVLVKYNGIDRVVYIPKDVTTIYNGAFKGNEFVTEIVFEEGSRLSSINSEAFKNCVLLSTINFPETIKFVGDNVMDGTKWLTNRANNEFITIAKSLIKYNGTVAKQVVIPEYIETINGGAFRNAVVFDILIGQNVKEIKSGAFDGVKGGADYNDDAVFNEWTITMLSELPPVLLHDGPISGVYKILVNSLDALDYYRMDQAWSKQYDDPATRVLEIKIEHTVTFAVDTSMAEEMDSQELYAIYSEVPVILKGEENKYIFAGWFLKYESGEYSESVSYPLVFTKNTTLYGKIIDRNVGSNPAFYDIKEINDPNPNIYIELYTYYGDSRIVVRPKNSAVSDIFITGIGGKYVPDVNGTHVFDIDSQQYVLPGLGDERQRFSYRGAFEGHNELIEVHFATITEIDTIGLNAFKDCKNLVKVVLPASIKRIEAGAFEGCINLREIIFEGEVSGLTIESGAFKDCTSLVRITLPQGVTGLADGAFIGCTSLREVTMLSRTPMDLGTDMPFDPTVEGFVIYIPHNTFGASYSSLWAKYSDYFVELSE